MKKDAAIALVAFVTVAALCYGLMILTPPVPPGPSRSASVATAPTGRVVMHVNGEPVTEGEFQAAFEALPDDVKRQVSTPAGKQAFAEQIVRMKLLEQEGRRMGVDRDARIAGQLAADRTNVVANAAAEKLTTNPSDQAVKKFYDENKGRFETVDVSHILVAYAGGSVPPRNGGTPPGREEAVTRAHALAQQLKKGADFATVANRFSDDPSSAERGGNLGTFNRGMLPPEIETRVFSLGPGQISDAVPTRFGVHIFKVNKRGTAALPDVSANIARHVKQQTTVERVEALRKTAKVDFDPAFFPLSKQPPARVPGKRPS